MGIGRMVGTAVVGLGLVGAGYTGLGGQDETTRNDDGSITESGEVGAFRIQLGDCINGAMTGLVESVEGVPCSTPHDAEVYHAFLLPDGVYPGDASVGESASNGCYNAFEPFVGHEYATSIYDISSLSPTQESWDGLRDREVLCLMVNYDGTKKTGSARGTGI